MSFVVATFALGLRSSVSGHQAGKRQAEDQSRLSQLQINEVMEALSSLGPAKETKEQVAQEEFQFGLKGLSVQTGIAQEDLVEQMNQQMQKSGLATSGTIEGKKSVMWKRIQGAFTRGQEGLMGQLGKSMGGIEEWFEGEKSRLENEKKRAQLQKQASDTQAGAKFLGIV